MRTLSQHITSDAILREIKQMFERAIPNAEDVIKNVILNELEVKLKQIEEQMPRDLCGLTHLDAKQHMLYVAVAFAQSKTAEVYATCAMQELKGLGCTCTIDGQTLFISKLERVTLEQIESLRGMQSYTGGNSDIIRVQFISFLADY